MEKEEKRKREKWENERETGERKEKRGRYENEKCIWLTPGDAGRGERNARRVWKRQGDRDGHPHRWGRRHSGDSSAVYVISLICFWMSMLQCFRWRWMRRTGTWTQLILESRKLTRLHPPGDDAMIIILVLLKSFFWCWSCSIHGHIKIWNQQTVMLKKMHNFYPLLSYPQNQIDTVPVASSPFPIQRIFVSSAIDSWVALQTKCRRWLLYYVLSMVLYLFMILIFNPTWPPFA